MDTVFTALVATVLDAYGNSVPSATVTLRRPWLRWCHVFSSGNTATTNSLGLASITPRANTSRRA